MGQRLLHHHLQRLRKMGLRNTYSLVLQALGRSGMHVHCLHQLPPAQVLPSMSAAAAAATAAVRAPLGRTWMAVLRSMGSPGAAAAGASCTDLGLSPLRQGRGAGHGSLATASGGGGRRRRRQRRPPAQSAVLNLMLGVCCCADAGWRPLGRLAEALTRQTLWSSTGKLPPLSSSFGREPAAA